jgi:hypothetical protein
MVSKHANDCPCGRCAGIRRHPNPTLCDWCHTEHAGDANNCGEEPDTDTQSDETFTEENELEAEKLMWSVINDVRQITRSIKEKYDMLPKPTVGEARAASARGRGQQAGTRQGLPYLSQTNMNDYLEIDIKYPVRIIDVRNTPGARSPVTLKLVIKGKTVLWGLSTSNPSYGWLIENLGDDENKWADVDLSMWLHEDEFDHRIWPTVGKAEKKKKE